MPIISLATKSLGFGNTAPSTDAGKALYKRAAIVALFIISSSLIAAVFSSTFMLYTFAAATASTVLFLIIEKIRHLLFAHQFGYDAGKKKIPFSENILGIYTRANIRLSNHVTETFEWKKELVRSAKSSIELSFNFAGGESLQDLLDVIDEEMHNKGALKTHLLLSKDLLEPKDRDKLAKLRERYSGRFEYLITPRIFYTYPIVHSEENHVKMLVVDGKYFVIGGSGVHPKITREQCAPVISKLELPTFAASFLDQTFRDTDIVGEGLVAHTMRRQFFQLYSKWEKKTANKAIDRYFSIAGKKQGASRLFHDPHNLFKNVRFKFLVAGPEHRAQNPITEEYAKRIRKAKKEVRLASLMFNPHEKICQALQTNTSIDRYGYFNGLRNNVLKISHFPVLQQRLHYKMLDQAFESLVPSQLYHRKVGVFDRKYLIVGSYNLSKKSANYDDEAACIIDSEEIAEEQIKVLTRDEQDAQAFNRPFFSFLSPLDFLLGKSFSFVIEELV